MPQISPALRGVWHLLFKTLVENLKAKFREKYSSRERCKSGISHMEFHHCNETEMYFHLSNLKGIKSNYLY